jgi:hypothetical protein
MSQSPISRAVQLLSTNDKEEDVTPPGLFAMSIRIPISDASFITTMAQTAGVSRNEMVNLIIDAGISEILSALSLVDPSVVHDIHQESKANIGNFAS